MVETIKFPIRRTRYYLNRCGICQASFDGQICPKCGRALVTGARDRLETIATRPSPLFPKCSPPFRELLPLAYLLAEIFDQPVKGAQVKRFQERVMESGRSERHLLTEASQGELETLSLAPVADAIMEQRNGRRDFSVRPNATAVHPRAFSQQMAFDL